MKSKLAAMALATWVAVNPVAAGVSHELVLASEVEWEPLNPVRGDISSQAGALWGDRGAALPTGFLTGFVDGFSLPPHIHNATQRAVVISGHIHSGDAGRD